MSNPKLSEIRARVQAAADAWSQTRSVITPPLNDIPYLLELVSRMGKALEEHGEHDSLCAINDNLNCSCGWDKARALLKEIEL